MRYLLFILFTINYLFLSAQAEPCNTGVENSCKCENAPVLCSFGELNNFTYEMTRFNHPNDGPDPMCPPPFGNNTASHNPTWFAFNATCADMEIRVSYDNCLDGLQCGGNNDFGIQAAVYEDCSLDPNSAVDGGCGTAARKWLC